MEYILVAISIASLVCNLALVRRFLLQTRVATLEVTEYVPLPLPEVWTEEEAVEEPTPAAVVPAVQDSSAWANRNGISGVNAAPPSPPIKPIQRPPLARPDGFI